MRAWGLCVSSMWTPFSLEHFAVQQVGGRDVVELRVPAEELEEFNAHIVGGIRLIARYDTVRD